MGLQMGKYTCLEDLWHPNMLSLALAFDLIAASRQALVKGLECLGAVGLEPGPTKNAVQTAPGSQTAVNQGADPIHCCECKVRRPGRRQKIHKSAILGEITGGKIGQCTYMYSPFNNSCTTSVAEFPDLVLLCGH